MLTPFDWIRICRSGSELRGTLRWLSSLDNLEKAELVDEPLAPPVTATLVPCSRCRLFLSTATGLCRICSAIDSFIPLPGISIRYMVCIWAHLSEFPDQLFLGDLSENVERLYFIKDANHFLMMLPKEFLQAWFMEMFLAYGSDLKGLIQIFPTKGPGRGMTMGEVITLASHHDAIFPMDALRVRFFTSPFQLTKPHLEDRKGYLTFSAEDFMNILNMGKTFVQHFRIDEQIQLKHLLLEKSRMSNFVWGRFTGMLTQEARDILEAWAIRQWPVQRIQLLFNILPYVRFSPDDYD